MPRPPDVQTMTPEARRHEIATILAAAMVRFRVRSAVFPTSSEELSKSSPTALASAPSSATHVTVREVVNAKAED